MNPIARQMTMAHIKVTGFARETIGRLRSSDRGQGTLEYVGIVLAVVALAVLLVTFFGGDFGDKIKSALTGAVDKVTGAGGGSNPNPSGTP